MPTISERAASGMWPTAVTVPARTMNAPPAIAEVPMLVSSMTPTMISCLPTSGFGVAPLGRFAAGDDEVHEDQGQHRVA
ncbi:hypothetical protein O1Q96_21285 [Streptomyces sp. Qhu-G9]|uniref:hypothetical protein n=1 Tax=Streptomyces sp. Qhu-G9 TaxID=3452799 RepID=UPI0022AC6441|nr:hypothetical protein [Streptomyces aurantiacus]WAU82089.1 hypothetical protein O1Q96_21285 [Streptomyces aurantiacus]